MNSFVNTNVDTIKMPTLEEFLAQFSFRPDFTVLVDMDGVMCKWQEMYDDLLRKHYPHIPIFPFEKVTRFKTQSFYADEHREEIAEMMNMPGFYRDLEPMEGSVEALKAMKAAGINVFLCTAPYVTNKTCASEKMDWVERHLGSDWLNKTIITSDKTLVRGDVLIDDKPNIKGAMTPSWTHIVFDAPYNRGIEPRLNQWNEWHHVLAKVVEEGK
jgi:5'-nucleotidase